MHFAALVLAGVAVVSASPYPSPAPMPAPVEMPATRADVFIFPTTGPCVFPLCNALRVFAVGGDKETNDCMARGVVYATAKCPIWSAITTNGASTTVAATFPSVTVVGTSTLTAVASYVYTTPITASDGSVSTYTRIL